MHFLRLCGRCCLAGTDSPDWLVGDYRLGKGLYSSHVQYGIQLPYYHFVSDSLLTLLQGLPQTQDRNHTTGLYSDKFLGYLLIGFAEQLTAFLSIHSGAPSTSVGVLRAITTQTASSEGAGYVACLDMGDAPRGLEALASEFVRFAETGDLRGIGELRYVLARRVPNVAGEKTFLLTVWADAALHLDRMLPRGGADAAGRDPIGVPRPPGTQRILSAWESQQPSSVFVYHFSASRLTEVQSFYRRELPRNGWTIVERDPLESMEVDGIQMLSAENGDRLVTVFSHVGESSQGVLTIAISESS